MKRKNVGFTLVELVIVIAVMAVLVGIVAPLFIRYIQKSKEAKMIHDFEILVSAGNAFCTDVSATGDIYNMTGDSHIYINWSIHGTRPITELDQSATKYCEEVIGLSINEYMGLIIIQSDGKIEQQLWFLRPKGKDIQYNYDSAKPGVVEGPFDISGSND